MTFDQLILRIAHFRVSGDDLHRDFRRRTRAVFWATALENRLDVLQYLSDVGGGSRGDCNLTHTYQESLAALKKMEE